VVPSSRQYRRANIFIEISSDDIVVGWRHPTPNKLLKEFSNFKQARFVKTVKILNHQIKTRPSV